MSHFEVMLHFHFQDVVRVENEINPACTSLIQQIDLNPQ